MLKDKAPSAPDRERVRFIDLPVLGSEAVGWLAVAEIPQVPFRPVRTYWTWGVPVAVERGRHAHKELVQFLVAVRGAVELRTTDPAGREEMFRLEDPKRGVLLPPHYWHTTRFGEDAVLLCLASHEYNEQDYIRRWDDYVRHWRRP
jgi:hypothetical protein